MNLSPNPLSQDTLTGLFRTSPTYPDRIINREGTTVEFKESYSHANMAQYFKTMAAYANNNGGYIFFGIGDNPRRLIGLKEKKLQQFETLKVEEFTKNLLEYFSPEILWDHCTFEFRGASYGVIYVYPLRQKPCICKKHYDDKNPKYTLKEGDIYYRYGGRSERIRYPELRAIIDETRKNEEKMWLEFAKKAAKIGVANAALLDLDSGKLSGNTGTVVLDDSILSKIAFIRQGQFVEDGGTPTLRVIGDVQIATGKVVMSQDVHKVVKAIEPEDIFKTFLQGATVEQPLEYVKRICSAASANYPVYYYIKQANIPISDALSVVNATISRSASKDRLVERLEGKRVSISKLPHTLTEVSQWKKTYFEEWLSNSLPPTIDKPEYCIDAMMCLSDADIRNNLGYIRKQLLFLYDAFYEKASSLFASNIRKAICRVDEAVYLDEIET